MDQRQFVVAQVDFRVVVALDERLTRLVLVILVGRADDDLLERGRELAAVTDRVHEYHRMDLEHQEPFVASDFQRVALIP